MFLVPGYDGYQLAAGHLASIQSFRYDTERYGNDGTDWY